MNFISKLLRDEAGTTAIEYGLIAPLVSIAAITAFSAIGGKVSALMVDMATKLQ